MSSLVITRGLPGSGKTFWASEWVALAPESRARVNRDDLRDMIHDGKYIKGVTEPRIIVARDAAITALLRKGVDVVCDDTNLAQRTARDLLKLARRVDAGFAVEDFTSTPLELCIERDTKRDRTVGEQVIRDMHTRYLKGRQLPLPHPEEPAEEAGELRPYTAKPGTPRAVMVDIDGTTALMCDRSPFDETRVHEDLPNRPVIDLVRTLYAAGHEVVFVSGRTDACREATEKWLAANVGVPYAGLHMREAGDGRADFKVKAELFDQHIRDAYDVAFVLDDRNQVVEMWRAMNLPVFQVADGNF